MYALKKILTASALALLLVIGGARMAKADCPATITGNGVNLRSSASSSCKSLDKLAKGEEVNILGKSGNWYKVSCDGQTGYVYKSYVSTANAAAAKPTTATKAAATGKACTSGTCASTCPKGNCGTDCASCCGTNCAACCGTSCTVSSTCGTSTLKSGCSGSSVKSLQQCLAQLGYLPSNCADGVFGPKTASAVKAFQADCGLTCDGIAGVKTLCSLTSSCGK